MEMSATQVYSSSLLSKRKGVVCLAEEGKLEVRGGLDNVACARVQLS